MEDTPHDHNQDIIWIESAVNPEGEPFCPITVDGKLIGQLELRNYRDPR